MEELVENSKTNIVLFKDMSQAEQIQLILQCRSGDNDAFNKMLKSLDGFFIDLINKYGNRLLNSNKFINDDLYSFCCDALTSVIEKYDLSIGTKAFTTYLSTAVIRKFIKQQKTLETDDALNIAESFETPVGDTDDLKLESKIADESISSKFSENVLDKITLNFLMERLPRLYGYVLYEHYYKNVTLIKIGEKLNLTKQSLSVIEQNAILLAKKIMEMKSFVPNFYLTKSRPEIRNILKINEELPSIYQAIKDKNIIRKNLNENDRFFAEAFFPYLFGSNFKVNPKDLKKPEDFDFISTAKAFLDKINAIYLKEDQAEYIKKKYGEEFLLELIETLTEDEKAYFQNFVLNVNILEEEKVDYKKLGANTASGLLNNIFEKFDNYIISLINFNTFIENNGGEYFLRNYYSKTLPEDEAVVLNQLILSKNINSFVEVQKQLNLQTSELKRLQKKVMRDLDLFFCRDSLDQNISQTIGEQTQTELKIVSFIKETGYKVKKPELVNEQIAKRFNKFTTNYEISIGDIIRFYPKLTISSKNAMMGYFMFGLSTQQIATVLQTSTVNVRKLVKNGIIDIQNLKAQIIENGKDEVPDNAFVQDKLQIDRFRNEYPKLLKILNGLDMDTEVIPNLTLRQNFVLDKYMLHYNGESYQQIIDDFYNLYGETVYPYETYKSIPPTLIRLKKRKKEVADFVKRYGGKESLDDFKAVLSYEEKVILEHYLLSIDFNAQTTVRKILNDPDIRVSSSEGKAVEKKLDKILQNKLQMQELIYSNGGYYFLRNVFAPTLKDNPLHYELFINRFLDYHYVYDTDFCKRLNKNKNYIFNAINLIKKKLAKFIEQYTAKHGLFYGNDVSLPYNEQADSNQFFAE